MPRLTQNYWHNFTIDTYRRDLLPAAIALGFKALFVDNLNIRRTSFGGQPAPDMAALWEPYDAWPAFIATALQRSAA